MAKEVARLISSFIKHHKSSLMHHTSCKMLILLSHYSLGAYREIGLIHLIQKMANQELSMRKRSFWQRMIDSVD